jgi:hypothetical protein
MLGYLAARRTKLRSDDVVSLTLMTEPVRRNPQAVETILHLAALLEPSPGGTSGSNSCGHERYG